MKVTEKSIHISHQQVADRIDRFIKKEHVDTLLGLDARDIHEVLFEVIARKTEYNPDLLEDACWEAMDGPAFLADAKNSCSGEDVDFNALEALLFSYLCGDR